MIDLSLPITYQTGDGSAINLNTITSAQTVSGGGKPISGYVVDGIRVGEIDPVGFTDARSTSDGIDVAEAYAARRKVEVLVNVYGQTKSDLFSKMQELISAMRFMPKRYAPSNGFRNLSFTMITANESRECYFYARPTRIPKMDASGAMVTGNDALGYSTRVLLEFLLKYPYKYSATLSQLTNIATNNTNVTVINHGAAPADATLTFSSSDLTAARTTDIKLIVSLNDTPITLLITDTIGLESGTLRSIIIDFKDQIVYKVEKNVSTNVITSSIAQNLIQIDSGATFGTVEPRVDYPSDNALKVQVLDAGTNAAITTGYKADFSWREMWY